MSYTSILMQVSDRSHVGEVRRAVQTLANELDFSKTENGNLAIIATELAGNLIKHAGKGEIVLRMLNESGIEILSLDNGKGMKDIAQCMEDGYSTAGSPGTGLGAVQRLSNVFDIYSRPEKGTAILCQFFKKDSIIPENFITGVVSLPLAGEEVCGDGWSIKHSGDVLQVLMVDGLGHGKYAFEAARLAKQTFEKEDGLAPNEYLFAIHGALRSTRGAAAAVLEIESHDNKLRFAGVGNIAGFVFGGVKERGFASFNGTLGHQLLKVQEINLPWPKNGLIIMHSDGLTTKWKLDDYPALRQRHPSLIAGVLYRDFQRKRDDVTVLVIKEE